MCFIIVVVVVVVKRGRRNCLTEKAKAQQKSERLVNSEQNFPINSGTRSVMARDAGCN